jgi:ADP-ribosylglycohydrolase
MSLEVAARGIPLGLLHAIGPFDAESLADDAAQVTRITHSGVEAEAGTAAVAALICGATRRVSDLTAWIGADRPGDDSVAAIARVVSAADSFEAILEAIPGDGIERNAHGAILGATAGAWFGVADIPQGYIDALDARIYLTLAAPWFFRTAMRRQGTVIDLRKA